MIENVIQLASSEKLTKVLSIVLGVLFVLAVFMLPTHQKVSGF